MNWPSSGRRQLRWLAAQFTARYAAVFFIGLTGGCVGGVPFDGQVAVSPSPVLKLSWVKATRTKQGILVVGQLQQVRCCALRVPGRMHLRALKADGSTIAGTEAWWGSFLARQVHSASFKAKLAVPTGVSVSKVEIELVVSQTK
jgi:hypothetical protein